MMPSLTSTSSPTAFCRNATKSSKDTSAGSFFAASAPLGRQRLAASRHAKTAMRNIGLLLNLWRNSQGYVAPPRKCRRDDARHAAHLSTQAAALPILLLLS